MTLSRCSLCPFQPFFLHSFPSFFNPPSLAVSFFFSSRLDPPSNPLFSHSDAWLAFVRKTCRPMMRWCYCMREGENESMKKSSSSNVRDGEVVVDMFVPRVWLMIERSVQLKRRDIRRGWSNFFLHLSLSFLNIHSGWSASRDAGRENSSFNLLKQ